ncbi:glycopeptide antibiotics resistance protein [Kibdelosporangium banguiense]|uniref:Glycopeptide antibiotics resistance protein n=1 Tax=Kibdelosporangium banguiense TaxID=1365924 RepID=A0ABS4TE32_9PSEU|nr:VanZ family protein [Kibdelosporangium banguiense]MBP2322611.1 glycopeptide antibiotics resistance protein [Kibdelosporangium banguiense]
MTSAQLTAIHFGLIGFALIWPVVLLVMRRRVFVSGVVTLYATLALAVVFLPLPGPGTPRLRQTIQLLPFQWVLDTARGDLLAAKQFFLNVLLFVPLGVFAYLLWRRTLKQAVTIGFGVSLLIEITQLSGNFGTAPFVYRIFDVDDLITNTSGALIGYLAAYAITQIRVAEQRLMVLASLGRARSPKPAISTPPHATGIATVADQQPGWDDAGRVAVRK